MPLDEGLRVTGDVKEADTRGETADRAVAPLAIDEGAADVLEEEIEDDRRGTGGAARDGAVVAMGIII